MTEKWHELSPRMQVTGRTKIRMLIQINRRTAMRSCGFLYYLPYIALWSLVTLPLPFLCTDTKAVNAGGSRWFPSQLRPRIW